MHDNSGNPTVVEYRHATPRHGGRPDVSSIDAHRLHHARRAATIERRVGEGEPRDRAETLVDRWEAVAGDRPRDHTFWDAFDRWRAEERR